MDIEKEREAFEQHLTDTGLVEFVGYGFAVDECDEYLHEPTQVAWDSWLIGLNRAKAQAIPDGFVLVPKEPTDEMLIAADNCAISGRVTANIVYKTMIEVAHEQNHESK